MDRQHIINKVLIKLNEVNPQLNEDIIKSDNINIKPIEIAINDILEESTYEVCQISPLYLLTVKKYTDTDNVTINNDGIAKIILPSNYFRFGYIKFPCWERPVFDILSDSHPEYKLQQNKYLRAGYIKPFVFIRKDINYFLECYTVYNDLTNKNGVDLWFVETPVVENINDKLVPLLVNIAAKKTLISMLRYDLASGLEKDFEKLVAF